MVVQLNVFCHYLHIVIRRGRDVLEFDQAAVNRVLKLAKLEIQLIKTLANVQIRFLGLVFVVGRKRILDFLAGHFERFPPDLLGFEWRPLPA